MVMLDATIVTVATPQMATRLHAGLDAALWVFNSYILVLAVFVIVGGLLGDMLGTRNVFVAGLVVFCGASVLCGLAGSPAVLIAARCLQGTGAALLTPQTIALVLAVFPRERLSVAFGIAGTVAGVAAMAGPGLGGLIVDRLGWRWIFFVNVPIGLLTILLSIVAVPAARYQARRRIDLAGVVLVLLGSWGVTFGLIEGERYNWGKVWKFVSIPLLMCFGAVALLVFVMTQRRHEGLIPFSALKGKSYWPMSFVSAAVQFSLLGMYIPLTIFLQSALGMSATRAGLTAITVPVVSSVVAPLSGAAADRIGKRPLVVTGVLLTGAGICYLAAVAGVTVTSLELQPGLLMVGAGTGLIFSPMTTLAMEAVPPAQAATASSVFTAVRHFGTVLAVAVTGAVLELSLAGSLTDEAKRRSAGLPPTLRSSFVASFHGASHNGVQLGASQVRMPFSRAEYLLARQVFAYSFTTAMRLALLLSACVLLLSLTCVARVRAKSRSPVPAEEYQTN
jgi:EmrB/QacA subfamily drug resistance transporter